ncbi:hypothetical protein BT63DRAFT_367564 [Microthyrium microscopicum]|uniref:PH domain-containing protein n=1 Tax=Microthyrium microscopicum TaxID=703497 RepID=A0A6A6UNA7_9PEZI|nr:hypothetical protein BT63DRAFT_367564 [Microthyrium microscopicum]
MAQPGADIIQASETHANTSSPRPALIANKGPLPYGYHNSFHTHALDDPPPTYHIAKTLPLQQSLTPDKDVALPAYSCSVQRSGVVGLMIEFRDPFMDGQSDRMWQKVYACLRGTQISLHWVKSSLGSKKSAPRPGKKVAQFSLQHAEVGLAVDVKPDENTPKNLILNMLPSNVRQKLQKTRPELFEQQKEWLLRMRVEGYQILFSFDSEQIMLDWCESICEGIDISPPIEDRTDPRYRSLPRRSRRQRQLENWYRNEITTPAINLETVSSRLVEQQERILREFYPNLADPTSQEQPVTQNRLAVPNALERVVSTGDADMDEFDPADVTEMRGDPRNNEYDPKSRDQATHISHESLLRYRRRCMPIMYKFSPRSSDIVFHKGVRWRIDTKKGVLRPFELSPPRYPRGPKRRDVSGQSARDRVQPLSSLRPQSNIAPMSSDDEHSPAFRSPTRGDDNDGNSIHSTAGLTVGSSGDAIEPVSTRVSLNHQLNTDDRQDEFPLVKALLHLGKPAEAPELRRRRTISHVEDSAVHAFTGLVL